jgi:hypothetical protein
VSRSESFVQSVKSSLLSCCQGRKLQAGDLYLQVICYGRSNSLLYNRSQVPAAYWIF